MTNIKSQAKSLLEHPETSKLTLLVCLSFSMEYLLKFADTVNLEEKKTIDHFYFAVNFYQNSSAATKRFNKLTLPKDVKNLNRKEIKAELLKLERLGFLTFDGEKYNPSILVYAINSVFSGKKIKVDNLPVANIDHFSNVLKEFDLDSMCYEQIKELKRLDSLNISVYR